MKSQLFTSCLIVLLGIACFGCSAQGLQVRETPLPAIGTTLQTEDTPESSQGVPTLTAPEMSGAQIVATNDIVGIWELSTHDHWRPAYWLVREDSSFSFSPQPDGSGASQSGKYWFENNLLMIRDDSCPTPGSYRIRKFNTSPVTIRMELVADSCEARIKILTGAPAAWTLPVK